MKKAFRHFWATLDQHFVSKSPKHGIFKQNFHYRSIRKTETKLLPIITAVIAGNDTLWQNILYKTEKDS